MVAIDVSNEAAKSVPYDNPTSICNHEEARIVTGIVRQLLGLKSREGKSQIDPWDIAIITPYKGQQQLLLKMLQENGPDTPEARVLVHEFDNAWGEQNSGVEINIVSLCCRNPQDPMTGLEFVAALDIQDPRSEQYQIITGNFKGWCKEIFNKSSKMHRRSELHRFLDMVLQYYDAKDIVSYMDVDCGLLTDTEQTPKLSHSRFYTGQFRYQRQKLLASRVNDPSRNASRAPKSAKKKRSSTANPLVQQTKAMALDSATSPQPPLSNRALKRQLHAAYKAKKEQEAKKAQALEEWPPLGQPTPQKGSPETQAMRRVHKDG